MESEFIRDYQRKEQVKKEMITKTDYIDWLIHFTEKYPIFSDNDWLYNEDDIAKEDYEKVQDLPLLFECISSFADRNYYASTVNDWGESYLIKKDDVYMNVGYNAGQGTSFYCERTAKKDNSINYYSIMTENLPFRTEYIDNKLQGISEELKELIVNLKVPVEFVEGLVENTQKQIIQEKELVKKRKPNC